MCVSEVCLSFLMQACMCRQAIDLFVIGCCQVAKQLTCASCRTAPATVPSKELRAKAAAKVAFRAALLLPNPGKHQPGKGLAPACMVALAGQSGVSALHSSKCFLMCCGMCDMW